MPASDQSLYRTLRNRGVFAKRGTGIEHPKEGPLWQCGRSRLGVVLDVLKLAPNWAVLSLGIPTLTQELHNRGSAT
jgi:hypothetical protein